MASCGECVHYSGNELLGSCHNNRNLNRLPFIVPNMGACSCFSDTLPVVTKPKEDSVDKDFEIED